MKNKMNKETQNIEDENKEALTLGSVVVRSEQFKCGSKDCSCYGLEEARECKEDCKNPIW